MPLDFGKMREEQQRVANYTSRGIRNWDLKDNSQNRGRLLPPWPGAQVLAFQSFKHFHTFQEPKITYCYSNMYPGRGIRCPVCDIIIALQQRSVDASRVGAECHPILNVVDRLTPNQDQNPFMWESRVPPFNTLMSIALNTQIDLTSIDMGYDIIVVPTVTQTRNGNRTKYEVQIYPGAPTPLVPPNFDPGYAKKWIDGAYNLPSLYKCPDWNSEEGRKEWAKLMTAAQGVERHYMNASGAGSGQAMVPGFTPPTQGYQPQPPPPTPPQPGFNAPPSMAAPPSSPSNPQQTPQFPPPQMPAQQAFPPPPPQQPFQAQLPMAPPIAPPNPGMPPAAPVPQQQYPPTAGFNPGGFPPPPAQSMPQGPVPQQFPQPPGGFVPGQAQPFPPPAAPPAPPQPQYQQQPYVPQQPQQTQQVPWDQQQPAQPPTGFTPQMAPPMQATAATPGTMQPTLTSTSADQNPPCFGRSWRDTTVTYKNVVGGWNDTDADPLRAMRCSTCPKEALCKDAVLRDHAADYVS